MSTVSVDVNDAYICWNDESNTVSVCSDVTTVHGESDAIAVNDDLSTPSADRIFPAFTIAANISDSSPVISVQDIDTALFTASTLETSRTPSSTMSPAIALPFTA